MEEAGSEGGDKGNKDGGGRKTLGKAKRRKKY